MFNTLINYIPYGFFTGLLTLVLALLLQPLARRIKLLDAPGGRKKHSGRIPLIGGICLYITFATTFFAASETIPEIQWLIISTSLLLVVGIIDDYFDIHAIYKLLTQILATGLMIWGTGIYINQFAFLSDGSTLELGKFGFMATILAVVGLVNAFNMSDGIDGLAGMQALISSLAISVIIVMLGNEIIHRHYLDIFYGAIGGYLLVNLAIVSRRKIFLGDSGSMMIGFICAWSAIYYSQLPQNKGLPPSLALWIFAIPVMDTLTLTIRRLLLRRSPFSADRKHLHHIFMRLGFTPPQVLAIITLISITVTCIGFVIYILWGDLVALFIFVLFFFGYYLTSGRIWKVTKYLRKRFL